jgi:hypothetical protein
MGAEPRHGQAILENGYGYTEWVQNFRVLLWQAGIAENHAVSELPPLLLGSTDATLANEVAEWLERQTQRRASLWKKSLRLLRKPPEIFLKQLARQLGY